VILSILSEEANPPLCNFAIALFPPYLRPLTSASSFLHYPAPSVVQYDYSLYIVFFIIFFLHLVPFPWDLAGELTWESPSKKDEIMLISWTFSECTNYKGLLLLFFSKFFTFSSVVTIRGQCVTPQEMLKVRCQLGFELLLLLLQSCNSQLEHLNTGTVLLTSAVWIRGEARIYCAGYSPKSWRVR